MERSWKDSVILLRDPDSSPAEAFRSLRARLSRSLAAGKRKLMLVSSWAGDGKSMVATNLAVVLAQLHLKVALMDGDLRKPTLTRLFQALPHMGLTDFLESRCTFEEAFFDPGLEGLSVVPCGTAEVNPANLLGGGRYEPVFWEFERFWRRDYRYPSLVRL